MTEEFESLVADELRLGNLHTNLIELIGHQHLSLLESKFASLNKHELAIALREVVKFIYLAANCPGDIFFPGNDTVDALWHELIIETRSYRILCSRMKADAFVDHTGIPFEKYVETRTIEALHEEQLTWLSNYVRSFGPIPGDSLSFLPLARELCVRLRLDLTELNLFAETLAALSESISPPLTSHTLNSFLSEVVKPIALELDHSKELMKETIKTLMTVIASNRRGEIAVATPKELQAIYSYSACLGFTMAQHFSAVERLTNSFEWQKSNPTLWQKIVSGASLCGLATTHLVKPGPIILKGEADSIGFSLSGQAPWSCGLGIFDSVLVGFETDTEIVYATMPFPPSGDSASINCRSYQLACYNGTSSVSINFNNYRIQNSAKVSSRKKSETIKVYPSRYLGAEIGIGIGAIELAKLQVAKTSHPRNRLVSDAIVRLERLLLSIQECFSSDPAEARLPVVIYEFNRDAIRVLGLSLGAMALGDQSPLPRLQNELLLFDAVIQSPETVAEKIARLNYAF